VTATSASLARLYVGTSGWSYPSWRPGFYPAEVKPPDFLRHYSERLPSVELNTTGYRIPAEDQFRRWAEQVSPEFRFAVKFNSFRFHVRAPIFVAREWFRHRVGSFNEFSMRYARATDDFYLPEPEDVRTQVGKPGSYSFDPVAPEIAETTREELANVYETAYATYERLVELGVARELARCALPVGAYTEFYWTVNARALMNFISLRAAETAQREIRRYAEACEHFFAEKMPVTHAAFVDAGRVAP
jgi:thymidylate synthase (FAD)